MQTRMRGVHSLTAIIARSELITRVHERLDLAVARVSLAQGLSMLRLLRPARDAITPGRTDPPAGFYDLWQVAALLAELSTHGPIAYVETEYFGGVGDQAAAVYSNGALVYSVGIVDLDDPRHGGIGNINGALELLGVDVGDGVDAFDAVGLSTLQEPPMNRR